MELVRETYKVRAIFASLEEYCLEYGEAGVWPSSKSLAKAAKLKLRSAQLALARLAKLGFVAVAKGLWKGREIDVYWCRWRMPIPDWDGADVDFGHGPASRKATARAAESPSGRPPSKHRRAKVDAPGAKVDAKDFAPKFEENSFEPGKTSTSATASAPPSGKGEQASGRSDQGPPPCPAPPEAEAVEPDPDRARAASLIERLSAEGIGLKLGNDPVKGEVIVPVPRAAYNRLPDWAPAEIVALRPHVLAAVKLAAWRAAVASYPAGSFEAAVLGLRPPEGPFGDGPAIWAAAGLAADAHNDHQWQGKWANGIKAVADGIVPAAAYLKLYAKACGSNHKNRPQLFHGWLATAIEEASRTPRDASARA